MHGTYSRNEKHTALGYGCCCCYCSLQSRVTRSGRFPPPIGNLGRALTHQSRGGADKPSCERAHSPIGMADRAPDNRWAGSLSGGRTTDRDISARRMVWCQQRVGSPRHPQACAGGQASENRPRRLELLLQLLLSWRDAMRSGY